MNDNTSGQSMNAQRATAVILDTRQRVLLHRRRDFHVWALPGGQIEPNETGVAAAIREAQEETGYAIVIHRFV